MIWGPAFVATSAALWSFFLLAGSGCGYNGAMCPDACVRVESHLRAHIFGQARLESPLSRATVQLIAMLPCSGPGAGTARRGNLRPHHRRAHAASASACQRVALKRAFAQPSPKKPLVVSLHGPPGVGKTFFHKLLAEAV